MAIIHEVDVDEIVDLIRATSRTQAVELLIGSLNIANGVGRIAGSQAMAKVADDVLGRTDTAATMTAPTPATNSTPS